MKTHSIPAIRLTLALLVVLSVVYPLLIAGIAKLAPGGGDGLTLSAHGRVVGYASVGQAFTQDRYFTSRPSAVNYNPAGSGGSNKGPGNPAYLTDVQARIDTLLRHNPGIDRRAIPSELVTASGSGLDPHLSPAAARIQIPRIATIRGLSVDRLNQLVATHTDERLLGVFGPSTVNVLKLNIALDSLSEHESGPNQPDSFRNNTK